MSLLRVAVFPGSFDPITLGHYDIIIRSLFLFDKIIIGITNNYSKKHMFSIDLRKKWIKKTFSSYSNINVESYKGLTISFCKKKSANFIIRSLRNSFDLEFEKVFTSVNNLININNKIETIFFLSSLKNSFISSSIVREIILNKGNYKTLVPKAVRVNI